MHLFGIIGWFERPKPELSGEGKPKWREGGFNENYLVIRCRQLYSPSMLPCCRSSPKRCRSRQGHGCAPLLLSSRDREHATAMRKRHRSPLVRACWWATAAAPHCPAISTDLHCAVVNAIMLCCCCLLARQHNQHNRSTFEPSPVASSISYRMDPPRRPPL